MPSRVSLVYEPELTVRLLGPVEVECSGQRVPISRTQVRALLAILAAWSPQFVGAEELIDAFWPYKMPSNPRRTVQLAVSRLRKSLPEPAQVEQLSDRYRLIGIATDIEAFERGLAAAAREPIASVAIREADQALELWRGTPFSGLDDYHLLEPIRTRLENKRAAGQLALTKNLLAGGQLERAVELAQPAHEHQPANEEWARCLAEALSRGGRRAEGLRVLDKTRSSLRDTGISPGPAMLALEADILDARLDPGPRVFAPEAESTPFVGRDAELATILDTVGRSEGLVIIGEPGAGKSRLLAEASAEPTLRCRGPVLSVTVAGDSARPLDTIARIVEELLDGGAIPLAGEVAAVERILPDRFPRASQYVSRDELLDHLACFITHHICALEATVIVDDYHLLDALSAAILERAMTLGPIPLIAGSRPTQISYLQPWVKETGLVKVMALTPLRAEDIAQYVALRTGVVERGADQTSSENGSPLAPVLADLGQRSGGNALFLRLLVDLALEGALVPGLLPPSLMVAVKERLDSLSGQALDAVKVAAAIGQEFSLRQLEGVRPNARAEIGEAIQSGLITQGADPDHYRFLHGLVVHAAYQLLPAGSRLDVHDQLGCLLQARGHPVTDFVDHFSKAAALDPVRSARTHLAAGQEYARSFALDKAAEHLIIGLEQLTSQGLDSTPIAIELMVNLGQIERLAGIEGHQDRLEQAAEVAELAAQWDWMALAVVEIASHGGATTAGRDDNRTLSLIGRTMSKPLSDAARAQLLAATTVPTALTRRYRQGQQSYRQALEIAQRLDDPAIECKVLTHIHLGMSDPDDFECRRSQTARLAELAGGDADILWEVAFLRFWDGVLTANVDLLAHNLAELRNLTPRACHRHVSLAWIEAATALVFGDVEIADKRMCEALNLARDTFDESWASAHYAVMVLAIRNRQGRLHELYPQMRAAVEHLPELRNLRAAMAMIATASDHHDEASRELDETLANGFSNLTRDLSWTAALFSLGQAAISVEHHRAAAEIYRRLEPFTGQMSWTGLSSFGPNDTVLAGLATLLGRDEDARRHCQLASVIKARFSKFPG